MLNQSMQTANRPIRCVRHWGCSLRFACGFTLIELVMTLIIVGILAFTAVGRLDFTSAFVQRGVHDKAISALQFARKAAVAQRRYVCVVASGTTLTFTIDSNVPESTGTAFGGTCPFATALNLPAKDGDCSGASAANSVCSRTGAALGSSPASFQFDAQGRASATVTITATGQSNITVEGETGYVH
jgi:MSHA pilin protein MshC